MFSENIFSKMEAVIEDSLKPTQVQSAIKYMVNVLFPMEAGAVEAYPMVHAEEHYEGKNKSPGYSTEQLLYLAKAMQAHCEQYKDIDISNAVVSRNEASKPQLSDVEHNVQFIQQREIAINGKDRLGGGRGKKRDRDSALHAGSKQTLRNAPSVGHGQDGGPSQKSDLANEDNPKCWQYYQKIKVQGSGASFSDLSAAVAKHHEGFDITNYGEDAQCRTKKKWIGALKIYLG